MNRTAHRAGRVATLAVASATTAMLLAGSVSASAGEARAHLALATRAARAQRWDDALAEYTAAQAAGPSAEALQGMAEAHDALRHDVEAYRAFAELLSRYGAQLSRGATASAKARLAALDRVTAALQVAVNVPGASVTIDGVPVGVSPLAAATRVRAGLHRVRATRDGYGDVEALPTVTGGQAALVELALSEATRVGHVVVAASSAGAATVLVDGASRGALPWEGDLPAGPHDLQIRSPGKASVHQAVDVVRGETLRLVLDMSPIQTAVRLSTPDRQGLISVDGAALGEGSFEGRLTIGEHAIRVTRAGYEPLEKQIELREGESFAETFTLTPVVATRSARERPFEGMLEGALLAGAFQVNGLNGDFSQPCSFASTPSPTSCSAGSPIGGAIMAYVGYTANPVGVDLLVGGQLDTASVSLTVQGSKAPESFTTPRLGALIAPRARVGFETDKVRFSFAAGVGIAVREVALSSHGVGGLTDSDPGATYAAPAITLAGSVLARISPKVAMGAGLMYWAESAGDGVRLKSGPSLTEPAVVLSAVQAMLLPYLSLEVGP